VEVQGGRLGQLVVQDHPNLVADLHPDLGTRDDAVVRPGLHDLARLDLPVDDLCGQLELLGAVGEDRRLEDVATLALGRLGEPEGDLVHDAVHRVGVHQRLAAVVAGRTAGSAAVGAAPRAGSGRRAGVHHATHAGVRVPGDRAQHVVHALGLPRRDGDGRGLAGAEVARAQPELRDVDVVHGGAAVRDAQLRPGGGDLEGAGRDRELRQVDVDLRRRRDRGSFAAASAVVVLDEEDRPEGDEDGKHGDHEGAEAESSPLISVHVGELAPCGAKGPPGSKP